MDLFISNLFTPDTRFFYFSWILVVIISVVLHELAHGYAAIRLGDETPLRLNRMTLNPFTHMGPYSLFTLFFFGIAWGAMPVDPTRLRGKRAESLVAVAGPATNLSIAIISLAIAAILLRTDVVSTEHEQSTRLLQFLVAAGYVNIFLAIFNLIPVPPLDGSHIMANYVQGYARLLYDPAQRGMWMVAFIFCIATLWQISPYIMNITTRILSWMVTIGI